MLGVSEHLKYGSQYTFTFSTGADMPGDAIIQALFAISYIGGVTNNFVGLNTNVAFWYTGDGSHTVGMVANDIAAALGDAQNPFHFISADGGGVDDSAAQAAANVQAVADASAPGFFDGLGQMLSDGVKAVTPSTGSLWAIALIAVAVVFVVSGGPAIVRSARA